MPISVHNPFSGLGTWIGKEVDNGEEKAHDLKDWASALIHQGVDKYIHQPKAPAPIYTFPTPTLADENYRDVGISSLSAATTEGRHLKTGVITRMAAPIEGDRSFYQGKIEVDLRSAGDISDDKTAPSWRNTPGFGYQNFPVPGSEAYDSLSKDRDLAFAKTMLLLQDGNDLVIHCTYGVDRTGMDVAMTMLAVGYDQDAARNEYMISAQSKQGPQTDANVFNKAVRDTLNTHGGTMAGYIDYLNGLLKQSGASEQIDTAKLKAAVLQ